MEEKYGGMGNWQVGCNKSFEYDEHQFSMRLSLVKVLEWK